MAPQLPFGGVRARAADALWRRARSGNGIWLAVAIMVSGLRLLRRWSKREQEAVFRREVAPGEQLLIRHLSPSDSERRSPGDSGRRTPGEA